MTTLNLPTPRAYVPLLKPARYKGAKGGRGSGKSHFFAELLVERCLLNPGTRWVCIREVQKSLKESAKRLIEDKINKLKAPGFIIQNDRIITPGNGIIIFMGMQDYNAESIKSLEGFDGGWCEEAQTLTARSLQLLRPTIRNEGSELWFSWNPRRRADAVDKFFNSDKRPADAVVVTVNFYDNPFFPDVLETERLHDLEHYPDEYDHVWLGGYAKVNSGAYYAASLTKAKAEGRISKVALDPLMTVRAFWDIGGTGNKADACAIWIAQFIGKEVRVLNYYEAVGQPLAEHVAWLRQNGYENAKMVLPHDGSTNDKVYDVSYESALIHAGFKVDVIPNQGQGAASTRVEAVRALFPSIWFNAETTEAGRDALGWYHEKVDPSRQIGLGPNHDWSSHGSDAFGEMAIAHKQMARPKQQKRYIRTVAMP